MDDIFIVLLDEINDLKYNKNINIRLPPSWRWDKCTGE